MLRVAGYVAITVALLGGGALAFINLRSSSDAAFDADSVDVVSENNWSLNFYSYDLSEDTRALCNDTATFVVQRLPLAEKTRANLHVYAGARPRSANHDGSYKTTALDGVPTVYVDLSDGEEHLVTLIAHELFHVYQGCTVTDLTWVHEGSAVLFQNMVAQVYDGEDDPFAYIVNDDRLSASSLAGYTSEDYSAYSNFNAIDGGFSDPNYAVSTYMCMSLMNLTSDAALLTTPYALDEAYQFTDVFGWTPEEFYEELATLDMPASSVVPDNETLDALLYSLVATTPVECSNAANADLLSRTWAIALACAVMFVLGAGCVLCEQAAPRPSRPSAI